MIKKQRLYFGLVAIGCATLVAAGFPRMTHRELSSQRVQIGENDIAGVVTSANGPEAGVWVIAETSALPTKFVKIVVTDDRGRYVIPELPRASYSVWARGYGLVDSPKRRAAPGSTLNLTAVVAPNSRAAAEYYPAGYWYSLMRIPDKSEFPGTGPGGNGISPDVKSQAEWLRSVKSGGRERAPRRAMLGRERIGGHWRLVPTLRCCIARESSDPNLRCKRWYAIHSSSYAKSAGAPGRRADCC